MENIEYEIKYAIEHMMENNYPRKELWNMDSKVPGLLSGIRAGDDAVVLGKSVYNMEGPYPLILGSKTALIHTSCDVVAMGARPLYAMDAIQASNEEEIKIAIDGLKKQSIGLDIPIIGGNTQTVESLKSCLSVVVFGELITEKIIKDSGSKDNDIMIMLGHPVEGDIGERVQKAKNKYETFLELVSSGIEVHACKDASRGGWLCNILEMLLKAEKGVLINSMPYPRATRYLGTYLVSIPEYELPNVLEIAMKKRCPVMPFGVVTSEKILKIGNKEYITKERMNELIKNFPYKY
ncbi:AIR synthase related protein [Methanococcus vannielii SB]|jgi:phosphoribosylformylglycinamidine cyclo-ligase|uniref:AIR synthase related protein n=1 Tax=Methanococcus vannielii (strain ATCC 35089 / DSM 1224 / JCM 13029 / OCM 148 / SB) TaxID=406327 RepID=A6UN81_METVS|nr:AIR synthase related protein [Methanococcus vannielii]ABR53953.1 AIR synthase related protein [Methanococcus vannielii SB]